MNRPQAYRLTVSSLLALLVMAPLPATVASQESAIAIVGATIIDGNGGAPVENGTIVVVGNRITDVGLSSLLDGGGTDNITIIVGRDVKKDQGEEG